MVDLTEACVDCDRSRRLSVGGAWVGDDWLCGNCLVKRAAKLKVVLKELKETTDALENLVSSEPDMPSHEATYAAAEEQIDKARAIFNAGIGKGG